MAENYLIIGSDPYVRTQEEKKLRDKFLASGEIDLNYSVCAPEDGERIMDSLGTMPFLADKRVVLVRSSQEIPASFISVIEAYLEKPSETSVLILSCDGSFAKKAEYRALSKKMTTISADRPTPQKLRSGIMTFFKKENVEISPRAVELILELKGDDPLLIKAELEKLAAYSRGEKIDVKDVEELVGRSVTETVFKLVDAINAKNSKWALRVMKDLGDPKKEAPKIIGYLAGHIRVIQKIKLLSMKGAGINEMVAAVGKRAYFAEPQARKLSVKNIDKWVCLLLEADTDIKRGRKEPSLVLEMLLTRLVSV
jgi:DNA polymerase III subunit delta